MSNTADNAHASVQKPLAVRLSEDMRAQLNIIAQLNDRSVTEEIRHAIEAWIQTAKADPKMLARAESVRAEIEREAATKKGAIEAIFAPSPVTNPTGRPVRDRK